MGLFPFVMVPQCCYFLTCIHFSPFLSYHTVALTTPPPPTPHPTSVRCHCDAPLAYKLTKQRTESRGHTCLITTYKNGPICINLCWISEHKVREVVDQPFQKGTWQRGAHFQESSFKIVGKKRLLSGLSALLKLILALCMVLYLLTFISPSFLLPKLKSPNKDFTQKNK